MPLSVEGVPSYLISSIWDAVSPYIESALEYADGKFDLDSIYTALTKGDMQLWLVAGGVWVTEIIQYPCSKRVDLFLAAGEWHNWFVHFEVIKAWGREKGCDAIEITGRMGWGRRTGFEEICRTYRVSL